MRIRQKIELIFGVTIVFLMGGVGLFASKSCEKIVMEQVKDSMISSAQLASDDVSKQLGDYMHIATATGHNSEIGADKEPSTRVALLDGYVADYGFTSGNILDAAGVSIKDGTDFSDRAYVTTALAGTANISEVTLSKYTGKYGISIAAPIVNDAGAVEGVVYYRMDNDFINAIIDSISVSKNSYAYIIDREGTVIAHVDETAVESVNVLEADNTALTSLGQKMISGESGFGSYTYNKKDLLCGYYPIANTDGWTMVIAAPETDFMAGLNKTTRAIGIWVVGAVIFALVVAFLLANSISKVVNRVKDVFDAISRGDLSKTIETTKRRDEIGKLQNTAASLNSTLTKIITEANDALGQLANYNLGFSDMQEYPGDYNSLSESINVIHRIIYQLIAAIQEATAEVSTGSKQLSDAADMLSRGTLAQATSIQGVVDDIHDISERINNSSKNGEVINQKLQELDGEIQSSNVQMAELMEAVNQVEVMSADIAKIVETIDNIAFQTNLLSLNASVEAARSGENGLGFAVVAEEVRELAAKCAEASTKNSELIHECIKAIHNAKNCATRTTESLGEIVENSAEISRAFEDITQDTIYQAKSSYAIQDKVKQISDVVQTNTATAEETAASTEELSEQSMSLQQLVEKFQL
ncbi:MAG: methyl-accepting chemotaxis protein [Lachnospiraceae bacterium]|nr:methyl-accepting chemotaxis protein [Lachnospiraceae bacterium]